MVELSWRARLIFGSLSPALDTRGESALHHALFFVVLTWEASLHDSYSAVETVVSELPSEPRIQQLHQDRAEFGCGLRTW